MKTTPYLACLLSLALSTLALAEPMNVGQTAPDFTLKDLAGNEVTLSQVAQRSKTAVIFLRGWNGYQCPACSAQTHSFLEEADAFKERGYELIFIYPNHGSEEETATKAQEFAAKLDLPEHLHFVEDPGVEVGKAYGLLWDAPKETVYPAFYVLDTDLKVLYKNVSKSHGGRIKADQALTILDELKS